MMALIMYYNFISLFKNKNKLSVFFFFINFVIFIIKPFYQEAKSIHFRDDDK